MNPIYGTEEIQNLVAILKKYRIGHRLTQGQMAAKCGIDRAYYVTIEKHARGLTLARLISLMRHAGWKIELEISPPRKRSRARKMTLQDYTSAS